MGYRAGRSALVFALMLSGYDNTPSAPVDTPLPAFDPVLEAYKACIVNVMNNSVLKLPVDAPGTDNAWALEQQSLAGCPNDFTEAFVRLRNAVRVFRQADSDLTSLKARKDEAFQKDIANGICSVIFQTQCTGSFLEEWERRHAAAEQRRTDGRAAQQQAFAEVEAVAARYGVSTHIVTPSSNGVGSRPTSEEDIMEAAADTFENVQ